MQVRSTGVPAAGLVVASVLVVDPSGLAPFGPAKWLVISTLALLAIAVSSWHAGARPDRRSRWVWCALVGLLGLAALTSGDVPTALLGHPDRHLGLVTWLLFWGLFTAGQRDCDIVGRAVGLGALCASGVLTVWVAWELAFGPPIALATDSRRLTGPFGSAAFLGAATCLLVPVAVAVTRRPGASAWLRAGGWVALAGGGLALLGSGSRAAWLGALVAVVAVFTLRRRRPPMRTIAFIGCLLLVAVAAVAPRWSDVTARARGSASRLDEWRVAVRVIADHPLLGVGPEGYRIASSTGIDAHYERTYGRDEVLPDRAHSGPLDVALAGGIPAALLYVGLVGFVVQRAVRRLRDESSTALDVGFAVGVIGYAAQRLLLFPLAELDPLWWLFAGIVVVQRAPLARRTPANRARVVAVAALVLAPLALVAGVLDVSADRLAGRALASTGRAAVADGDRAAHLRPDDVRYRIVAAVAHSRRGTLADVDAALAQIRAAQRWSPHDPIVADEHASLLSQRAGITGTSDDVSGALTEWRALVARDPNRARWQLQLGYAAARSGDVETARAAWTAAAVLAPNDSTATGLLAQLPPEPAPSATTVDPE